MSTILKSLAIFFTKEGVENLNKIMKIIKDGSTVILLFIFVYFFFSVGIQWMTDQTKILIEIREITKETTRGIAETNRLLRGSDISKL